MRLHFAFKLTLLAWCGSLSLRAQSLPHPQAHAHNDYAHARPLFDALKNGFCSVEADVHLRNGKLLVSHNRPGKSAKTLEELYLAPLDSLVVVVGSVYQDFEEPFLLMIDIKTEATSTYHAIQMAVAKYRGLQCKERCPVKIFLSGNRPVEEIRQHFRSIALDGRPGDLGKGYSTQVMPVVSDHFRNWSNWEGESVPTDEDLSRVRNLVNLVHAEGKKLRLWAIPDNPTAWKALLDVGVDFINSDRLEALNKFLTDAGH